MPARFLKSHRQSNSPQVTQFLQRASGLTPFYTKIYNNLIDGLVADGVWQKLDTLWILAAQSEGNAKINLVSSSFTLIEQTALTFAAGRGYTAATTNYLDTQFTPSTAGGKYSLNSASFGVYQLAGVSGQTRCHMGVYSSATAIAQFYSWHGNGNTVTACNDGGYLQVTPGQSTGFWCVTRPAANSSKIYQNGSQVATTTGSGNTLPSHSFYLLAYNNAGTSAQHALGSEISAAFIGGGLDATQNLALSARINAYMTALGINVY